MIKLSDKSSLLDFFPQPAKGSKREAGLEIFKGIDFPTSKHEEWKYSEPRELLSATFHLARQSSQIDRDLFKHPLLEYAYVAVVVNGFFSANLSRLEGLPEEVIVCGLAEAQEKHSNLIDRYLESTKPDYLDAFSAMNLAFFSDGIFIYIPDNILIDRPLAICSICTAGESLLVQPRHLVVVGKSSAVSLVEFSHYQSIDSFENQVFELIAAENSSVEHLLWQAIDKNSTIHTTRVSLLRDVTYRNTVITTSGNYIRNNLSIKLLGENVQTYMNGLYLLGGNTLADNHTSVDHTLPNSYSNQLYKGILDGQSTAVFNGKIFVRPNAQKTNAYQANNNILLSTAATVNTKPQLEIWANDVKCSHGSTVGALDEEPIFYLRTRGLTLEEARKFLIRAFVADVLERIQSNSIKDKVSALLDSWLSVG